ncbi:hypothetical protein A2982_03480 [candidate division WWE3 bacterium RIFCSPLOWO2_01_FULL_39_13]|uniref:R3H domain-containing protein n=1 Tax=candidate division WWE3 bacterium RIFCSPLOWO2_01_FULL_39_13 TaxID=1802624 RepID=A0A1F4V3D5_UNCKA|nr:MAG: hypothetical protein A2982_03480 [candidate division WWE3 bacterium RIFCSPLOWO2_01_FULL_39_13]
MDKDRVKSMIGSLLESLGSFLEMEFKVSFDDSDESVLKADIETGSANLLIGYRGENLSALQHFINVAVYKQFKDEARVMVDIADYRGQRNQKLADLAESAASKAKEIGKQIALYPMNSFERRIVHEKISKIEGVSSHSEGEGLNRKIIISLGAKE